jgi:Trypsin-like peptidase domain
MFQRPSRIRLIASAGVAGLALGLMAGCATPKVTPSPALKLAGDLRKYRKVYVVLPTEDSRKVGPKVAQRLEAVGFQVERVEEGKSFGNLQGTGFIVSREGHVLTCAHVLGTNRAATVWISGRRHEAAEIRRDETNDLVLLKLSGVDGEALTPLPFAPDTNYFLGQEVFTMGFPLTDLLGTSPRLTKGLVSATVGTNDQPNLMQISAEVQPGNSGGPLLNGKAEIVGVISATLNPLKVLLHTGGSLPQNVNFAIKASIAHEFLGKAGLAAEAPPPSAPAQPFEDAKGSVALLRAGIIPPGCEQDPEMLCVFAYSSRWDMWFRFLYFHVEFYDLRTDQQLLKAGVYRDDMISSEDAVLNRTFAEIRKAFFPGESVPEKETSK